MDRIEEIWDKGNDQISKDEMLSEAFIRNSISETSISITSKLPKLIWFGMVAAALSVPAFIYNIFFYRSNTPVLILILILLLISCAIFTFLLTQLRVVKKMDTKEFDLQSLLVYKIKYFTTRFQLVQHSVSFAIVLATFTINLTMENSDGVFELRKILILSAFYLFIYLFNLFLYRISYNVYLKQLRNALVNLEENTLKSFDKELKKHKRIKIVIGLISACVLLSGIIYLILKTGS